MYIIFAYPTKSSNTVCYILMNKLQKDNMSILNINENFGLVKSQYDFEMKGFNLYHDEMRAWIADQFVRNDILDDFDEFKKWLKYIVRAKTTSESPVFAVHLRVSIYPKPTMGDRVYVVIIQNTLGVDRFYFSKL